MDKRKYIKYQLLLKFSIYLIAIQALYFYPYHAYASAWLPDTGIYKVTTSYSLVDRHSQKLINAKSAKIQNLQNDISLLAQKKNQIYANAAAEGRGFLYSHEEYKSKNYDSAMSYLRLLTEEEKAFSDQDFTSTELEYGYSPTQSAVVRLTYKRDINLNYKSVDRALNKEAINTAKEWRGNYKQQLWRHQKKKRKNYTDTIISISPFIGGEHGKNDIYYYGANLMWGVSSLPDDDRYSKYLELGSYIKHYIDSRNRLCYGLIAQEGINLSNTGFILNNFTSWDLCTKQKLAYKAVLYEQVALSKDLPIKNFSPNKLNISVAYFWKSSLSKKGEQVSGGTLALTIDF